jgi:hypothetical protein
MLSLKTTLMPSETDKMVLLSKYIESPNDKVCAWET